MIRVISILIFAAVFQNEMQDVSSHDNFNIINLNAKNIYIPRVTSSHPFRASSYSNGLQDKNGGASMPFDAYKYQDALIPLVYSSSHKPYFRSLDTSKNLNGRKKFNWSKLGKNLVKGLGNVGELGAIGYDIYKDYKASKAESTARRMAYEDKGPDSTNSDYDPRGDIPEEELPDY